MIGNEQTSSEIAPLIEGKNRKQKEVVLYLCPRLEYYMRSPGLFAVGM